MARKYQSAIRSGHSILVIDDSLEMLRSTRDMLEREGHRVLTAPDGETGVALARRERPHLILIDLQMPGLAGEEVVRAIREFDPNAQIILVTGYSGEKPPRVMMQQLDIQGFHDKAEGAERLLLWVDSSLKAYRHLQAMEKHRTGLQYILDITPDLHRLQPLDDLLQGILWQIEGLVGAENSFLATYSSEQISRAANEGQTDGFVALVDERRGQREDEDALAIRVGTGRFRSGIPTASLPEPARVAVEKALASRQVSFQGGISVVPLTLRDQLLGVIYVDRRPGVPRDRDLLEIFATQAASAIQSALLYGQNALLLDLATRDPITRVFLRGYAMQQLHQHLKRSRRSLSPISVLMIDLDRLGEINDGYGHVIGDEALRTVGELLRGMVRETDCVARYGGDEFLVVLPETSAEGARQLGIRIFERLRSVTVSAGSAQLPIHLGMGVGTLEPPASRDSLGYVSPEAIRRGALELVSCANRSLELDKHQGVVGEPHAVEWAAVFGAGERTA